MPLRERALIANLRTRVRERRSVVRGIGDDCAVLRLPRGHQVLVTTDFTLEGIHFHREWHPPEAVGHRCLARGLSDIAAMGGEPLAAFLSLALPRKLPQRWVDRFFAGLLKLAEKFGTTLAGGDIAESLAGILADITVVGSCPAGRAGLRSTARPGDRICVSGVLGASAATLGELRKHPKRKLNIGGFEPHFFPEPRVRLGRTLREKGLASAMIDISDGLSTDLQHICDESGVGAELQAEAIPVAAIGRPRRPVDFEIALHGGDDYELLFTASPGKRIPSSIAGVPVTWVGRITRGSQIFVISRHGVRSELQARGWEHFRK
ncbi:MAG TPA: thiamine-phosphate kinase [Terriglobales bacterium]